MSKYTKLQVHVVNQSVMLPFGWSRRQSGSSTHCSNTMEGRKTSQFWNAVPVPSLLPDIFLFLSYLVKLGINCISTTGKFYFFSCSLLMLSSCRCFGPVRTAIHIYFTSYPTPVVRFFPEALQDRANKIFQTRS